MKIIDTDKWKRKVPYENFRGYTNPTFSLSARLDVTNLCERCKREHTSFFTDYLFIVTSCLNSIEEFRLRLLGGKVVLYENVHPSYIVLSDDDVIVTCRTEMSGNYSDFYAAVRADITAAKSGARKSAAFNAGGDNNWYYVSCMPWADLSAVNHPYDYKDEDSCSIPRIAWSKFVNENGRMKMMTDISAHHALLDGEPVCRAFVKIQQALDDLDGFFAHYLG